MTIRFAIMGADNEMLVTNLKEFGVEEQLVPWLDNLFGTVNSGKEIV